MAFLGLHRCQTSDTQMHGNRSSAGAPIRSPAPGLALVQPPPCSVCSFSTPAQGWGAQPVSLAWSCGDRAGWVGPQKHPCLGAPHIPDPDLLDVRNQQALGLLVCLCCPSWGGKLLRICLWHRLGLWAGRPGAGLRGPGKTKPSLCLPARRRPGQAGPPSWWLPPTPCVTPLGCHEYLSGSVHPDAPTARAGGPRLPDSRAAPGCPAPVPWHPLSPTLVKAVPLPRWPAERGLSCLQGPSALGPAGSKKPDPWPGRPVSGEAQRAWMKCGHLEGYKM